MNSHRLIIYCAILFCKVAVGQTLFTSTFNTSGNYKKLVQNDSRFPNYSFEWSIGESAIISTNTSSNIIVTHGLLQGYLLNNLQVPSSGFWYPDEIKLYPNPIINDFTVDILTAVKGVVFFNLYDIRGIMLSQYSINYHGTGQTEHFNISHLPSGNYLLRVSIKGFPESGGNIIKQGVFNIIKLR